MDEGQRAAAHPGENRHAASKGWPDSASQLSRLLAKLGISGPGDLLLHLPLRYEDETRLSAIAQIWPGATAQAEGEVISAEVQFRPRRQLIAQIRDDSGSLTLRWLNFYPSLQKQLSAGKRVRVFGEVRGGFFGSEMIHPRLRVVAAGEPLPQALTPVYPTTAGLAQSALRKLVARALPQIDEEEYLPVEMLRRFALPSFAEALRTLHQPPPQTDFSALEERSHPAWRRIRFEELLVQQLSLRRAYNARHEKNAPALAPRHRLTQALLDRLPFALTGAQRRVSAEIAHDLAMPHPMQRLLQGDVGSGKTIVAALAMLQAVENGWQAALMAPTEILAEQHYLKLSAWLAPLELEIAWLSGSRGKRARERTLQALASGQVQLAVGTHALIEDPVTMPKLGLSIVDEQHRFGVRQRLALREKSAGEANPHMLMMSATPIPRTLAMTHYADLDISVLDELPPGRTPVLTKLVSEARREEVIARVRDACAEGRQAYWVCPLIEESEQLQLKTALEIFSTLAEALPELRVGLVHGRLKAAEKSATMNAFAAGELDVLVATTVIEVGVDVPNASVMVVEHAERFGLAQLHQLRGRVGRGSAQSVCILLFSPALSQTARARLKVIFEHGDGFVIAREDLRIRGPGEFVGARQSGIPLLRYADLEKDVELIEAARELAARLLAERPEAADKLLMRWIGGREGLMSA